MLSTQEMAAEWYHRRFPDADNPFVVLAKAVEELGEVATALIYDHGTNSATGKQGSVPAECADVAITLMALLAFAYPDSDLFEEIHHKLDTLLTPGAHKSGVPA